VTWNNIWKQCTGEGLLQLSTLDEEGVERPAKRWKCGHVSPDMGSNNVACVSYLQYGPLHLNLDVTYDFSHGAYNDVKGMEKDVGLWPSVLMLTTAYNCRYGSDLSPNRLKQIRESLFEYMLKADPQTCPLYNGYLPDILRQAGVPELMSDPDIAFEFWDKMIDDPLLTTMLTKVNLSRFFDPQFRAMKEKKVWAKQAWIFDAASAGLNYFAGRARFPLLPKIQIVFGSESVFRRV
jgi:hypothetical protein